MGYSWSVGTAEETTTFPSALDQLIHIHAYGTIRLCFLNPWLLLQPPTDTELISC